MWAAGICSPRLFNACTANDRTPPTSITIGDCSIISSVAITVLMGVGTSAAARAAGVTGAATAADGASGVVTSVPVALSMGRTTESLGSRANSMNADTAASATPAPVPMRSASRRDGDAVTGISACVSSPPDAATIVAIPARRGLTSPFSSTVAMAGVSDRQTTADASTARPSAVSTLAPSISSSPTMAVTFTGTIPNVSRREAAGSGGATRTAGTTSTVVIAASESSIAAMVTVPGLWAVTTPASSTLAIAGLLDDHSGRALRSLTSFPCASVARHTMRSDFPISSVR